MLRVAVLGREPFEEVVRVGGIADGERADLALLPAAVEDDDAARPPSGDEARERVDELGVRPRTTRVEEVVAVEEVQVGSPSARRAARWRRSLVEEDRRRDADVQRADLARERDRDDAVARPANERPHALPLGAEHERDAAREVGAQIGSVPSASAAYAHRSSPLTSER